MGGEAWNVQKGKRAKRQGLLSLSDWLEQNGYPMATVSTVFNGSYPAKKLEFLKRDRREANGPDGNLSRAQRLRILGDAGGAKLQPKKVAKPTAVVEDKAEADTARFIIVLSKKGSMLRLHRSDGCSKAQTLSFASYEFCDQDAVPQNLYSHYCHTCWPRAPPQDEPQSGSASGSSSDDSAEEGSESSEE